MLRLTNRITAAEVNCQMYPATAGASRSFPTSTLSAERQQQQERWQQERSQQEKQQQEQQQQQQEHPHELLKEKQMV